MKSLSHLSDFDTVERDGSAVIHRPQFVEIREWDDDRATERVVARVEIRGGGVVVAIAPDIVTERLTQEVNA